MSWIKKKTGPPAVTVDSPAGLAKFADDAVVLLGYFAKFEVRPQLSPPPLSPSAETTWGVIS